MYEIELFVVPFAGSSGTTGNLNPLGDAADLDDWGPLAARLRARRAGVSSISSSGLPQLSAPVFLAAAVAEPAVPGQLEIKAEAEGPAVRAARQPQEPTKDEVLQHEVSHEPYRAWCASCVAGRGLSREHRVADHEESAVAVAGFDYGFFSEGSSPLLCGKDSKHRWFYAAVVHQKELGTLGL